MKLTEPHKISEAFLLISSKPPTEGYTNLADEYLKLLEQSGLSSMTIVEEDRKGLIRQAQLNTGFYPNWGVDAVVKNFDAKCTDYVNIVAQAKEEKKILYTQEIDAQAEYLKNQLVTGTYTAPYFDESLVVFNQVTLFWKIQGIEFKCKIDRIIVNTTTKTITITDIKTYNGDFEHNFYEYMYWLQALIYKLPLKLYKRNKASTLFSDDLELEIDENNKDLFTYLDSNEYRLDEDFIYLTVDKSGKNPPIPFVWDGDPLQSTNVINIVRKSPREVYTFHGWLHMARPLWLHITENQWEAPWELVETKHIHL
jgi:hypothetical protein